jgi:hypothetical protein
MDETHGPEEQLVGQFSSHSQKCDEAGGGVVWGFLRATKVPTYSTAIAAEHWKVSRIWNFSSESRSAEQSVTAP